MKSKHIFISLMLVLSTAVLFGQKGISEGSTIVLNEGKFEKSQVAVLPKFIIHNPDFRGGEIKEVLDQRIEITGEIDNLEGLRAVFINETQSSLNEYDLFTRTINLNPGVQEIKLRAIFSDAPQIDTAFKVEYVTPMVQWAREAIKVSKYHALIIGIDEYADKNYPTLSRPVKDAREIAQILTTIYAFEEDNTHVIENATKKRIVDKFEDLQYKVGDNDNLLVFYAGHGSRNSETGAGYWIPSDAQYGRTRTYFSLSDLLELIEEINAKHTLVISDACVAGALISKRAEIRDPDKNIQELFEEPSCRAITSASFKETDDNSLFAKFLIDELSDLSESDEVAIATRELYTDIHDPLEYSGGDPQFGILDTGMDQGGDFVFIRKQD